MNFFTTPEAHKIFIGSVRNTLTALYPDWKFIQPMEKYLFYKDNTNVDLTELYQACQQTVENTVKVTPSPQSVYHFTTDVEKEPLMVVLRKLGFDLSAEGHGYINYSYTSTSTVPKLIVENRLDKEGHCILRYHSGNGDLLTFSVWMDAAYVERLNLNIANSVSIFTGTYDNIHVYGGSEATTQKTFSRIRDSLLCIKTIQECDPEDLAATDKLLTSMSKQGTYQELLANEKKELYSRMQKVLSGEKFVHSFSITETTECMLKLPAFYEDSAKDEDPFSVCSNYKYVFYIHDNRSDQFYRVNYKAISEQIFVHTKPQTPLEIHIAQ